MPLIISVAVFALIIGLHSTGLFSGLEYSSYDSKVNVTAPFKQPSDDVIMVLVNQESITEATNKYGWSWPWPREAYGKILSFIDLGNAASCSYDILFSDASAYSPEDDKKFASALSHTEHTKSLIAQFWDGKNDNISILKPLKIFEENADFVSNTTSIKDKDDMIRRCRVTDTILGEELTFMGFAPLVLENKDLSNLPYLKDGTLKLNYKGDIDRYPHCSAMEILNSIDAIAAGETPLIEPETFENAHVFVVYYAPGLFDICSTPIGKTYPGSGVAMTVLDNYLTDSFIIQVPVWVNVLLLLAFCFAGAYASTFSSKRKSSAAIIACNAGFFLSGVLIIWILVYVLFLVNIDILMITLLSGYIISFLGTASVDYFMEGKQKRFIKSAFSQYLSPGVINQLISNPDKLKLGGERRNLSIFFSDVQSFTTLSEGLSPEALTDLLNCYLSEMTKIILESGGTIDKYEGDAIIAFWNAPADIPNHSIRALEAAVKCQEKLSEMENFFIQKVGRPMWTRIGINTGDAVVGNMGSESRFDYTMFGDSVNLASRLEGLNKQFGTYLMCSVNTKNHAENSGCDLFFRELGKVQVVGKTEAVQIFEPMTQEAAKQNQKLIETFSKGLECFYKGNLSEALEIFSSNEEDAPSKKYAAKCSDLISTLGGTVKDENWQGVWVASSK